MIRSEDIKIFCGGGNANHLAYGIVTALNTFRVTEPDLTISHINFGRFSRGEPDIRIPRYQEIVGKHVIFFSDTHEPMYRLQLLDILRQLYGYGAKSIVVVTAYMAYGQQDHPEKKDEAFRILHFLEKIKRAGGERTQIIVCDPHSKQMVKAARSLNLKMHVVDPTSVYVNNLIGYLEQSRREKRKFFLYSPDLGSIKRCIPIAKELNARGFEVAIAFNAKRRRKTGKVDVSTKASAHDLRKIQALAKRHGVKIVVASKEILKGSWCCMRDDILASGSTLQGNAEKQINKFKVYKVLGCVTHPVCVTIDGWKRNIGDEDDTLFVVILICNTIYRTYEDRTGGVLKEVRVDRLMGHKLYQVVAKLC